MSLIIAISILLLSLLVHVQSATVHLSSGGSSALKDSGEDLSNSYQLMKGDSYTASYTSTGSGTGILKVIADEFHISFSDSVLKQSHYDQVADIQQLPLGAQAVGVIYNLPGLDDLQISQHYLAQIFLANVTKWNQIDPSWPDQNILRVVRGTKSGTSEIFVDALAAFNPEWDSIVSGAHSFPDWPNNSTDHLRKEDLNIDLMKAVVNNPYSIGYVPYVTITQFELKYFKVQNKNGLYVGLSTESLTKTQEQAQYSDKFDASLINLEGDETYPIAGFGYSMGKRESHADCDFSLEAFRYLYFLYTDDSVDGTLEEHGVVSIPSGTKAKIVEKLKTEYYCDGELLYPKIVKDYTWIWLGPTLGAILICSSLACVLCCFIVCSVGGMACLYRWRRKYRQEIYSMNIGRTGPQGYIALAFTDIRGSSSLWEASFSGMQKAMDIHDRIMRDGIFEHNGFEVKTEGDAFMVAFASPTDAIKWAASVQEKLNQEEHWPAEKTFARGNMPQYRTEYIGRETDTPIFRGLRVRIGLHCGEPIAKPDKMTGRTDYFGPMVNKTARIADLPRGGQVVISDAMKKHLIDQESKGEFSFEPYKISEWGSYKLKGIKQEVLIHTILPNSLRERMPEFKKRSDREHHSLAGKFLADMSLEDSDSEVILEKLSEKDEKERSTLVENKDEFSGIVVGGASQNSVGNS